MTPNCKKGSAWDTWQRAGAAVKGKLAQEIIRAAEDFAYGDSYNWPEAGQRARYRAFMEGVLS